MSGDLFDVGIRLRARDESSLVTRAAAMRVQLMPHARAVGIMAMSGDHAGLWAISVASLTDATPSSYVVGDPRRASTQNDLWAWVADTLGPWLRSHATNGTLPQLILADRASVEQFGLAADRVVRRSTAPSAARNAAADVVRLVHLSRYAGQQAIIPAAETLAEHYTTGADPAHERHLGLWLTWPNMPAGWDDTQHSTPPDQDIERSKLAKRLSKAERADDPAVLDLIRGQMTNVVDPYLRSRVDALRRAATLLWAHPGPVTLYAADRANEDAEQWSRDHLAEVLPSGSVRARVQQLETAEWHEQRRAAALRFEDHLEQERAVYDGTVLQADATTGHQVHSSQQTLRIRHGDVLTTAERTGEWTVRSAEHSADGFLVTLEGAPDLQPGPLRLIPKPSNMPVRRIRWNDLTWTHNDHSPPPEQRTSVADGARLLTAALDARTST